MIVEKVESLLEKIKKEDKKINSFIALNENVLAEAQVIEKKKKKGRLYGKVIGIKSNINVAGQKVTCASKTLENHKGSYDATVISKIKAEDGLIIGMLNMDEFAAGNTRVAALLRGRSAGRSECGYSAFEGHSDSYPGRRRKHR